MSKQKPATAKTDQSQGLIRAFMVFIAGAGVSWLGWSVLGIIPRTISKLVPAANCVGKTVATLDMYICSAKVALMTLIGPLLLVVVIFIFRKSLTTLIRKLTPSIPENARFLTAPMIAVIIFTMVWAGIHYQTSGKTGILPQKFFPAVIGLFTFLTSHYLPLIQEKLSGFLDWRDKFPKWLRLLGAILLPMVISLIITYQDRVSAVALKEQIVVLISLTTGFLALMPRKGGLAAGVKKMMQKG